MVRWLGLVLALALVSSSADAQVFKPRAKKAAAQKVEKKPAKKAAKKAPAKKRPKAKKAAATRSRPDDLTPEPAAKDADQDYVRIWDDDEPE